MSVELQVVFQDSRWYDEMESWFTCTSSSSSLDIMLLAQADKADNNYVTIDPVWAVFAGISPERLCLLIWPTARNAPIRFVKVGTFLRLHLDDVSRRPALAEKVFMKLNALHNSAYPILQSMAQHFDLLSYTLYESD